MSIIRKQTTILCYSDNSIEEGIMLYKKIIEMICPPFLTKFVLFYREFSVKN